LSQVDQAVCLTVLFLSCFSGMILIMLSYIADFLHTYNLKKIAKEKSEEEELNSLYQAVTDEPLSLFDKDISNDLLEDMNYGGFGG